MGAAISKNVAKQIITTSTGIANSYVQQASAQGSEAFGLTIGSGCTSNIGTINITNKQVINVQALQNTTTQNSMRAAIQAQITQQAVAAAQSLGGPSASFAENISDFAVSASNTIKDVYTQTCLGNAEQSQNIICGGTGASNTIGAIDISNTQNAYTDCTANNATINNLVDTLASIINDQTSAKEADTLGTFVVVGIIFLGIIGLGFVYAANGPIGWVIIAIIAVIVVVLIVYATLAFSRKLYPFSQGSS